MSARVLLVDDDSDLLNVMAEVISTISHSKTVSARSLRDLQQRGDEILSCEIAFLDVNLGWDEPSGIDVLRWLRRRGFRGQVYFFTGHGSEHPLVIEASSVAGAEILPKPIGIDKLSELIGAAEGAA